MNDTIEMQRIVTTYKDYYEQLYAQTLNRLEKIDNFLETYNLPRWNHNEMENLNRLITNNEVELVKNTSQQKSKTRWLH